MRRGDPSDNVRTLVAACPETPRALLEQLQHDRWLYVRVKLAMNPASPPAVVEALAADSCVEVRRTLVHRTGLPEHLFVRLAADGSQVVRENVAWAYNPATPTWLVEQLARDDIAGVRLSALWSGRLSKAALLRLTQDDDALVARAAEKVLLTRPRDS